MQNLDLCYEKNPTKQNKTKQNPPTNKTHTHKPPKKLKKTPQKQKKKKEKKKSCRVSGRLNFPWNIFLFDLSSYFKRSFLDIKKNSRSTTVSQSKEMFSKLI